MISAISFEKLDIGLPDIIPLAIFLIRVIRFGSVVTCTVLMLLSVFLTDLAAFDFISLVFLSSMPGSISKPTKAVEPETTTVAFLPHLLS